MIDGEFGGDAFVFGVDDEFKVVEIEDILGDFRVCVHGFPTQFAHGVARFLQEEASGAASHFGVTAINFHRRESAFEVLGAFCDAI